MTPGGDALLRPELVVWSLGLAPAVAIALPPLREIAGAAFLSGAGRSQLGGELEPHRRGVVGMYDVVSYRSGDSHLVSFAKSASLGGGALMKSLNSFICVSFSSFIRRSFARRKSSAKQRLLRSSRSEFRRAQQPSNSSCQWMPQIIIVFHGSFSHPCL